MKDSDKIAQLEATQRHLVSQTEFWKDQAMQYANQLQQAWKANAELLRQVGQERGNVEFRRFVRNIERAIERATPKPAEIAAVIARSGRDTQGVMPVGFDPNAQPRRLSNVIDVESQQ
jgi:hypothetical protein